MDPWPGRRTITFIKSRSDDADGRITRTLLFFNKGFYPICPLNPRDPNSLLPDSVAKRDQLLAGMSVTVSALGASHF